MIQESIKSVSNSVDKLEYREISRIFLQDDAQNVIYFIYNTFIFNKIVAKLIYRDIINY